MNDKECSRDKGEALWASMTIEITRGAIEGFVEEFVKAVYGEELEGEEWKNER